MKKVKIKKLWPFFILFIIYFFSAEAAYAKDIVFSLQIPIPGLDAQTFTINGDSLGTYIAAFYRFAVGALAIISVVVIMIGGFQWLMAAGISERAANAKDKIMNAVVGLILALTSYLLLNTVNPNLVNFQTIDIGEEINTSNINGPKECEDTSDCQSGICYYNNLWGYKTCQVGIQGPDVTDFCGADTDCVDPNPFCVIQPGLAAGTCLNGNPWSSCYENGDCLSGDCDLSPSSPNQYHCN